MQLMKQRGESLKSSILASMQLKTTEELEEIWRANDRTQWSDTAFDVVHDLLLERTNALPEQAEPITSVVRELDWQDIALQWLRAHTRLILIALCPLLITATIGIMFYVKARTLPTTPSVDSITAKFLPTARLWQVDAYMTNFGYRIAGKRASRIVVEYHSKIAPHEILFLETDKSGKIYSSFGEQTKSSGSAAVLPILRQEWSIDTQEALSIFAEDKEVQSCLFDRSVEGIDISLNKALTKEPAWILDIWNCEDRYPSFMIDAKTGKPVSPSP